MYPIERVLIDLVIDSDVTGFKLNSNEVLGIYAYGSSMYKTMNERSDYDFVVIIDMQADYLQFETSKLDIHFISPMYYKKLLKEHDIMALECFFNTSPILKYDTEFELDLFSLRKKISAICNNSWVKASKKLNLVEEDDYTGLKSLFHSFRILSFGIDLAKDNKINFEYIDNEPAIEWWYEIQKLYNSGYKWEEFKNHFKEKHNALASEFRKLAPKE